MPPLPATPLTGPPIAGMSSRTTKGSRVPKLDSSVYDWWKTQDHIPSVRKMAYHHLYGPTMSSETERCFRGTKLGISETRKRLDWVVIEASEVSRGLVKYGVF
jgi:hypothetical protein